MKNRLGSVIIPSFKMGMARPRLRVAGNEWRVTTCDGEQSGA